MTGHAVERLAPVPITVGEYNPFSLDAILPCQWKDRAAVTPELKLAIAVFEDAVNVLVRYRDAKIGDTGRDHGPTLYQQAWQWMMSDDQSHIFSFLPMCDLLGLSPGAVRRVFRTAQPVERLRHLHHGRPDGRLTVTG